MVKLFAALLASAALVHSALGHMQVISPPPRSGIIANELNKPCGGANTLTTNVTTYDVNSNPVFVLRPSHGTGNIIFNYFTDLTVTNDTKSYPLANVPVPVAGTYNTTIDFAKAGLKDGQSIVVQAIYNGTDSGATEEYYVCFDIKLASLTTGSSTGSSSTPTQSSTPTSSSTKSSTTKSNNASSIKAVLGSAFGLAVAAALF
ncbi:hypothetical protein GGI21_000556 [Coemansia aciculifera]|nr:hypothetical protein GGI21_000556 [Coemansia aciculifera]